MAHIVEVSLTKNATLTCQFEADVQLGVARQNVVSFHRKGSKTSAMQTLST